MPSNHTDIRVVPRAVQEVNCPAEQAGQLTSANENHPAQSCPVTAAHDAYDRTNLTLRQPTPPFGIAKSGDRSPRSPRRRAQSTSWGVLPQEVLPMVVSAYLQCPFECEARGQSLFVGVQQGCPAG